MPKLRGSLASIVAMSCLVILGSLLLPPTVQATTQYNVSCSVTELKGAINNANTDGDESVLNLASACVYALSTTDNVYGGNNGLPTVAADGNFTINGNGATIRRSNGRICEVDDTDPDTEFRMFVVSFGAYTVTINDLNVTDFCSTDGSPSHDGGAILADDDDDTSASFVINRSSFHNNETDEGGHGGVLYARGNVTVTDSTFSANTANGNQAGAIYFRSDGQFVVTNSTFSDNTADGNQGGAIYSWGDGQFVVTNSAFHDNTADGNQGGAIWSNGDRQFVVNKCAFRNNKALGNQGGAIYSYCGDGATSVTNSTFDNNQALNNGGGAIYASGNSISITNSTFSDNNTDRDGGALYALGVDHVNVMNCTFSGNNAGDESDHEGGAIYTGSGTNLNITNCTFVENTDGNGNTFNDSFATFILKNSIVVNQSGNICAAAASDGQDNLLTDDSCGAGVPFNLGGVTNLLPLGDYGGPTETFALGESSNAVDSVTDCTAVSSGTNPLFNNGDTITSDQRGEPRPQGVSCDIGAFEGTVTPMPVPTVSQWGMAILALLMTGPAIWILRRRKKAA